MILFSLLLVASTFLAMVIFVKLVVQRKKKKSISLIKTPTAIDSTQEDIGKRILVFAPHPDDEIIGCGGSLVKHINNGAHVTVVYVTSGDAGSLRHSKEELAAIREKEAKDGAQVLGIHDLIFLNNPDGYLEFHKQKNIVEFINIIREKKPHIIYTTHPKEQHKDHATTGEIVIDATYKAAGPWFQETTGQPWFVPTILGYEVWTPLQHVSMVEDITNTIDTKIQALKEHVSQIKDISYDEGVKGLNRYRGTMTGQGSYCECFEVIRKH